MRDVRGLSAGAPWGEQPAVLHLDIDAFFAAVEQLRNPALRSRPVIVGSGVVASASYEARACGIHAGTSLVEARRRCPEVVVLAGHAPTYRAFAEHVFELAADLSPNIETFLDDALVDLTGTECLHGHLIRAVERLRRRVREETGLTISCGLGTNRLVARMLTRLAKPGGFAWLRPGGEAAFVGRRPIGELPGIGLHRAALLHEMGITRVAELRRFSAAQWRDLFGEIGLLLQARAQGRETQVMTRGELPRSIRRETSFAAPCTDAVHLGAMLHYLLDRAAAEARRLGASAQRLRVHLRWADGGQVARQVSLSSGVAGTAEAFAAARALLRVLRTRRLGVRNLGVQLARFEPASGAQLALFESPATAVAAAEGAGAAGARAATREGVAAVAWNREAQEAVADGWQPAMAGAGGGREARLDAVVDRVREQFGFGAIVRGASLELLGKLPQDGYGFVLRTPCLTR